MFVRQGCCWNQPKLCFFPFILAVLLEISNFPSFKGGVSSHPTFCRWGLNQPPNPPAPRSPSGRFRGVLVPTTSGETLIDFMVNGESILGSPCLGQCWWRLVGGFVDVGTLWLVIERWSLFVGCFCLDGFCVFFWSELLFIVLILFFLEIWVTLLVMNSCVCFFWSMPAPQKHLNAQL